MAQLTDSQLTDLSNTVQNETAAGANTATRIGQLFNDLTDSKINNDKISTDISADSGSDSKVPSVAAVENYISDNPPPTPNLQSVINQGNATTSNVRVLSSNSNMASFRVENLSGNTKAYLSQFGNNGLLALINTSANELNIKASNITLNRDLEAPDKSGTIATTDDIVFYRSIVSLSSSDIANMDSVQIIAVPAPPSGKAISVTNITVKTNSGTGWSTSNNILLRPVGGSSGICATQAGPLSTANGIFSENVSTNWVSPTPSNAALEFRGSQGVSPSGGTLSATVYITYQLINI